MRSGWVAAVAAGSRAGGVPAHAMRKRERRAKASRQGTRCGQGSLAGVCGEDCWEFSPPCLRRGSLGPEWAA